MPTAPDHHAYPAHWEADVVLRDGGIAQIRPITPDDAGRLVDFYERVSDQSKYYRFFAPYPRLSDRDVHRFTHHDYVDRVGLAAVVGDEFIATVRYDRIDRDGRPAESGSATEAEVAFLVEDAHQGRGVASTLLEHIAAVARERDVRRFVAEVLPANTKMIKVFTDAGYTQRRSFEDGVVRLEFGLEPTGRSLAVMRAREQRAEARSVQRLLAPGSVAVVGTRRAPGGVGRAVLGNLLAGGFTGRAYAVNHAFPADVTRLEPEGVPAHRSVREIGAPVDLAVVAVPADQVPSVVEDCGEHGVQGLVVVTAGYAESGPAGRDRQRELRQQARSYGMRVIGPNALGVINTADSVRLNASLATRMPRAGPLGLFTQSGAIGIALLSSLYGRGAGPTGAAGPAAVSTFVSAGNRVDVSGNDLLQYWHDDPRTDVVLMYLESIGNPRKFTRLARRTAAAKPLVVVKGARHTEAAPTGHTVPTTRVPDDTVSALLRQAGVIRVDTVTELADTGLLLASQPLPEGPRVAILGNSESLGLLAYDACLTEGLRPLRPRDLTTAARPADFRTALADALADEACDAVVVNAIPWVGDASPADLATALRRAVADGPRKPVAVVELEVPGLAEQLAGPEPRPPAEAPAPGASGGSAASARSWASAASGASPTSVPGASAASGEPQDHGTPGERTGGVPASRPTPGGREPVDQAPAGQPQPPPDQPHPHDERDQPDQSSAPRIPSYPAAERAVRALAEAVRYARWRWQATEPGRVPEYEDIDEAGAAADIEVLLAPAGDDATAPADAGPTGPTAGPVGPPHGAPPTPPPGRGESGAPGADVPETASAERAPAGTGPTTPGQPRKDAGPGADVGSDTVPDAAGQDAADQVSVSLSAADTQRLLARYGISVLPALAAPDPDTAVRAAARLGYPVALKATAPRLRHRADLGGVRLDLGGETELRRGYAELIDHLGATDDPGLVVQRMAPRGVDTVLRAAIDPAVGAVLSFGLAGAPSELLGDTAHRLVPATDRDARELIRSIRSAPLLFGWRGSRPVDTAALEELVLRVSRLVDDHPQVVAVDLEPVVVAPEGLSVLGAAVRLATPPVRTDLGPRSLPAY